MRRGRWSHGPGEAPARRGLGAVCWDGVPGVSPRLPAHPLAGCEHRRQASRQRQAAPARSSPGGFHGRAWGTRSPGWHVDKVPLPRITPNRPFQGDLALWVGNKSLKRVTGGHRSMDVPVTPAMAGLSWEAAPRRQCPKPSTRLASLRPPPRPPPPPPPGAPGVRRRCRLLWHLLAQLHPLLRSCHKVSSAGPPPSKHRGRAGEVGGLSLSQKPGPPTCRCHVSSRQTRVSPMLSTWLSPPTLLLSPALGLSRGRSGQGGSLSEAPTRAKV